MNFLIKRPEREIMFSTLPGVFSVKFPRLTTIIVGFACTPNGSVSFLSCAWCGRVSDRY